jgi:molybdenum cofactor biosynthesis enzyme
VERLPKGRRNGKGSVGVLSEIFFFVLDVFDMCKSIAKSRRITDTILALVSKNLCDHIAQ